MQAAQQIKVQPMREIRVEKITLNFGAGANQAHLEKGIKLLKMVSGKDPIKTLAKARIPTWALRPGLPIGCKITLRGLHARELLGKLFTAADDTLSPKSFDAQGNFSFGVKEYINIPGVKYDPEIGILGFDVAVTLFRRGYRVMRRARLRSTIGHAHRISKEEAQAFVGDIYRVKILS